MPELLLREAEAILRRCLDRAAGYDSGLFCGSLGIGWTVRHLFGHGLLGPEFSPANCLAALNALVDEDIENGIDDSELLNGAAGYLIYLLESPTMRDIRSTKKIIDRLERSAVELQVGTGWPIPGAQLRSLETKWNLSHTEPIIRLGVAHGLAGTLGALGRAAEALAKYGEKDASRKATELIREGTALIRNSVMSVPDEFGEWVPFLINSRKSRFGTGWCNGDLGIGAVLYSLGKRLDDPQVRSFAREILAKESLKHTQDIELDNQLDFSICHGSSGRALIFHKMFQDTNEQVFRAASEYWLNETLSLIHKTIFDTPRRELPKGLLMGGGGVALVLDYFLSSGSYNHSWDAIFLL